MTQERFYYSSKSSALQLVDQDVVSQIIQSYANGESIDVIKKKFHNIPLTNSLYTNLPHEITKEKCVCGDYLYKKVEGRSAWNSDLILCINCGHNQTIGCNCNHCTEQKYLNTEREKDNFRNNWKKHFESTYKLPVNSNDINLMDQIHLITVLSNDTLIEIENNELILKISFSPNAGLGFHNHTDNEFITSFEALVNKQIINS